MIVIPWFKVDDNLAFHHKVVAAGNPAIGLWARAGALCAQQLTDGFVPDHMIVAMGTKAQAEKLVTVGLWDRTEGGYTFHGWDERQPSKASVEAERAAAQERMRAYRAQKKKAGQKASPQVSESRSPERTPNERRSSGEVRETFANPDPTHPDPTRPDPIKKDELASASSRAVATATPAAEVALFDAAPTAQTLVGEWIDHCPTRPPGRVIGQVSKELKTLLDEGIEPERVRAALAEWNRKGLHPSTLASVVHEITNRQPAAKGQQATNDMFDRAMQRAIEKESA